MYRREFLTLLGFVGIGSLNLLPSELSLGREIKNFVKSLLHLFKPPFDVPKEGHTISVEMALNSRCTSDYDENPEKFHWGMFDNSKKLSSEQIKKIISLAKTPQFTEQRVEIRSERNILTFIVEPHVSGMDLCWYVLKQVVYKNNTILGK